MRRRDQPASLLAVLAFADYEEWLLNLAQAVEEGQEYGAYRVVGTQRIFVELGVQRLRVLVQCWSKRRWLIPNQSGGVRYLNGVLRDVDGSWIMACGDLATLESVTHCLPAMYQHLLTPDSDDWQTLRGKKAGSPVSEPGRRTFVGEAITRLSR